MYAHRINPWDDVAPDEELPHYEASTTPAYETDAFDEPLVTYHLRQYDRKIQMLVAYGTSTASSYRITTNSFRLFSKKPEMEILYTSKEMRQRNMATIEFDTDGPLPWCPRAHLEHSEEGGGKRAYAMESKNFADWTIVLGGRTYEWTVTIQPSCGVVLREKDSTIIIARFTYSACGTQAARGAEVGDLAVFRNGLTMETHGMDKVVCSLMVMLTHLKRAGRCYSNTVNATHVSPVSANGHG
jgi:hypothetical protein